MDQPPPRLDVPELPQVSVRELFFVCLKVGSLSFGGGLSGWLFREFVQRRNWISDDDFLSTLALMQVLPGVIVVNLVVCLGEQLRGPAGAVACLVGFLTPPLVSVVALLELLKTIPPSPVLDAAMQGVTFAALGLLLQVAWVGLARSISSVARVSIVVGLFVTIALLHMPILAMVLLFVPLSILISWRTAHGC